MKIKKVFPHISIILSLMLMVFFVIDRFNEAMAFINNNITKWLLCVFCIVSFIVSLMCLSSVNSEK